MAGITHIASRSAKRGLSASRGLRLTPPFARSIHGPNPSPISRAIPRNPGRKSLANKPGQPIDSKNSKTQPFPRPNAPDRAVRSTGHARPIGANPSFRPGQTQANDSEGQRKQEAYKAASRKWTAVLTALPIFLVTSYYLFDRLILKPPPRPHQAPSSGASRTSGAEQK